MALPATIYKATITLSDIDRGRYETLTATVAQHPSETEERLVARLLAYALFSEDDLTFTKGLCAGDEPELWVKGGDGRVLLWVEVGLPDSDRIVKASRHCERVALLACGRNGMAAGDRRGGAQLSGRGVGPGGHGALSPGRGPLGSAIGGRESPGGPVAPFP